MTPAARLAAAIEVFDDWASGTDGLDRILARWGRAHRFAGSGDRHAIADLVYEAVRRRRSLAWVAGGGDDAPGRTVLRGLLLARGEDPREFFTGMGHAPAALSSAETADPRALDGAPRGVRLDIPELLIADLAPMPDSALDALRFRAPLDLRVNTLRGDVDAARAGLAAEGVETDPGPLSPTCLRVRSGQRKVRRTKAYTSGHVEIQDAASQAVADLAAARPGETVLDLCAGGGGKALAMAATMAGDGRLIAHDISPARLGALGPRAARAGAAVEIVGSSALDALAGRCDLVLVDAPCTGSGAWRRNPDAKWRLTDDDLKLLAAAQSGLLARADVLAAPSGRIVYATCSLIARENAEIVHSFLRRGGWRLEQTRILGPLDGGDGFYAADLRRSGRPLTV